MGKKEKAFSAIGFIFVLVCAGDEGQEIKTISHGLGVVHGACVLHQSMYTGLDPVAVCHDNTLSIFHYKEDCGYQKSAEHQIVGLTTEYGFFMKHIFKRNGTDYPRQMTDVIAIANKSGVVLYSLTMDSALEENERTKEAVSRRPFYFPYKFKRIVKQLGFIAIPGLRKIVVNDRPMTGNDIEVFFLIDPAFSEPKVAHDKELLRRVTFCAPHLCEYTEGSVTRVSRVSESFAQSLKPYCENGIDDVQFTSYYPLAFVSGNTKEGYALVGIRYLANQMGDCQKLFTVTQCSPSLCSAALHLLRYTNAQKDFEDTIKCEKENGKGDIQLSALCLKGIVFDDSTVVVQDSKVGRCGFLNDDGTVSLIEGEIQGAILPLAHHDQRKIFSLTKSGALEMHEMPVCKKDDASRPSYVPDWVRKLK